MRDHHIWPKTIKRRFWSGEITVSVFRASAHYVPVNVRMEVDNPDMASTVITVPSVTPRKHEMHLNRASREDELVHGYLTVMDDRWLLGKIIISQSPLMWCNKLNFSRNVMMEQAAIDALQHIRGSTVVQEALADTLKSDQVFWRTRIEAGRGLVHLAIGCSEREALHAVTKWLGYNPSSWNEADPAHALTWAGVGEYLAVLKRNTDRRDHPMVHQTFYQNMREIETCIAKYPNRVMWRTDPFYLLANSIKFVMITSTDFLKTFKAIDTRIRSDLYGDPLESPEQIVMENALAGWLGNTLLVSQSWPFFEDVKFLERIAGSANRRLARMAIRGCLSRISKSESQEGWLIRILWLEHITRSIIENDSSPFSIQAGICLVDAWEALLERTRKEVSPKSPLMSLLNKEIMCDKLWRYLTHDVMLLPPCVRSSVQNAVQSLYIQVYGTSVPGPYKESVDQPRDQGRKGPMSYWLPIKDHERAYRRFIYRGETVKPEMPQPQAGQQPKRPKLLIKGVGSVPLAPTS